MFRPVLLISEIFFHQSSRPGIYREVIEAVVPHQFYTGVETAVVQDRNERASLRSLCEKYDYTLLQWLTKSLLDRGISLASLDENERLEAVQCVTDCIDLAHDAGAFGIGLISGADPGPEYRAAAQNAFAESMRSIAAYLAAKDMTLVIETLDRDQHKKQVLGPTAEGVRLIRELRTINPKCGLCWDSAHVALMGEDFDESLKTAAGSAVQMHLANAVLDMGSYFYGDHHVAPDSGIGFLTREAVTKTLQSVIDAGACGEEGIMRVGVESRSLPGNDPWVNEQNCRELLQSSLARLDWSKKSCSH